MNAYIGHYKCIICRSKDGMQETGGYLCRECFDTVYLYTDKKEISRLRSLLLRIHLAKEMNDAESKAWIDLGTMFKDENYN